MRKKQIFLYLGIFFIAILAMLGIAFGIRQAIRAGNLAGIDWYNTYDKEFVITTEEELYDLVTLSDYYDFEGQTIKLGADIVVNEGNAEDWQKEAPEKKWQPITEFAGTFDGQGHSISGLYGKSSSMSMGLFSETKETCVIKDFELLNSYFTNTTNNGLGSIMGEGAGTIQQVYSNAIIYGEGESNGGIAGLIKDELELKECWFDGQVIGEQRSNGGMIGWVDRKADVTIDNCLNSGFIQFIGEGNSKTGGFVGGISDIAYRTDVSMVTITNSLTTGEVEVTNTSMAGVAVGTVRNIGALTFGNTYAVIEITDNASSETTVGTVNGKMTGNVVPRYRETLIGVGGYQWTNLDFDKYWSCVEGDTPILKCFAEDELSLDGVAKMVDTSWYVEGQTEFVIEDVADFWGFAMLSASTNFEGVTIKLAADITLNEGDSSAWRETAPEYNWFPIYSFSGVFEGQGHTISGVYSYSNGKRISLFQQVNANGSIANFKLVNSYIRGTYCIGAVVAHGGGNISNIYSDAIVENTGEHTGGILGAMNQNGTISNCWFDGTVYGGTSYTGGITSAAMSTMGVITHCLNTGDVYGGTKHSTGGLVGIVNNALTLSDSLNAGKVDDTLSSNKNRTGSVIGRIFDSTEKQTITANISATYTTRESYETSIGQGYPLSGAPAVNTLAELKGNEGYRRTLLNFEKYWAIDKDSHPTLQTFADEIPSLPSNVKRPIVADISWYDDDETVFVLKTPEELYGFAQIAGKNDFEGKTVKLGKNITINTGNAAGWGSSTPLNQWASIHGFNGTFDGAGHTISGLFVNDGLWKVGLFGNVADNVVIKNVKVTNSYFEGAYHIGAIAGMIGDSTVQGVYSDANIVVRKGHGGGLIGTIYESKVDNAWFNGTITGECNYIGGIASFISTTDSEKNTGSVLSNCLNTGTVTGASNVGGIVGRVAAKGTIKYSLGAGTVTGAKNAGSIIGVVVNDDITSCNIAEGVYATKESAKKTVGNGGGNGAVIVNTTAELTGVGGYQRTILDFEKYWSIVETSTPILKKFAASSPAIPNVARATAPDTSWYSAKKDTFVLTDYADLYGLAVLAGEHDFAGKTIKLGGNIIANEGNAADFKTNTPLNQLVPISNFAGTFDGQGYTISGLSANNESAWYVGVIGRTQEGAVVKNVNVENSYLTGEYHIGSVVGSGNSVKIENVYSNAIMEATQGHLGGIVGSLGGVSSVSNCWFDGSATTPGSYVGGITSFVGNESKVTISHCLNTAPVKAKSNAAGIVGRVASELTLTDSVNAALINCMGAAGSVVGMITEDGKVTLDAVYGVQGTGGRVVGKGNNYTGDAQLINEIYLSGTSGYTYTNLDFNKYWSALDGETPQLSYFSDKITAEKVSLKGVDRIDTSWYDADKKSYVLNDRADLFGFTYLLNSGNTFAGKTVTLGKNIKVNDGDATKWADGEEPLYQWMPIGSYDGHSSYAKAFMGTFNGKMHSISGLYTKNTGAANKMYNWCAGLFAKTGEGAVVKNVEVLNSYFESPYYNGVVGTAAGTTIDTVYTDAIVVATGGNAGGIVGSVSGGNVNNAWFDGMVSNKGQFTGGIAGVANDKVTISNCLTTGTVKSTTSSNNTYTGGLVGGVNTQALVTDSLSVPESISTVKNYCVGSVIGGVGKTAKATATNTYTLDDVSKLTIGQQVKPEEIGATENRISLCADLTGLNGYSLTKLDFAYYWVALAGKTPELMSFSDGTALAVDTAFRPSTEWYTEAVADAAGNAPGTEENPYVIYNKVDLYGFAELVNGGTTFAGQHVRLGADIYVNVTPASTWEDEAPDYVWEPIGSYVGHSDYSKSFAGTFDGLDTDTGDIYRISGLYTKKTGADNNMNNWCAGLFGRTAEGATVKNVKVLNSYFAGSTNNGVIGHATGTTIENVYSDAIIVTTGTQNGGIVGAISGGSVEGAWFAGTITSKGQFVGGIAGLASGDASIENSLTTGTVTSTYSGNAYAGGLVGCASGDMSLTNSVSAAKEVTAKGKRAGAAFGSANAGTVTVTMDEVYVIAGAHKFAVGEGATGTYTEQPWVMPTLDGYNGYTLTKLDFENTWVAVADKTPELKVLSEETALNVADSFRPDTTWYTQAADGVGATDTNPYVISTKEELYGLAQLVNEGTTFEGQYLALGADITVNALKVDETVADWAENAPAQAWTPIGFYNVRTGISANFMGTFDGANPTTGEIHSIIGLYMDATEDDVNIGGLFVDTTASTIKNLRLENSYISGAEGTAAIAGWKNGGTFDTLYTDAIVKSTKNNCGGIVGLVNEADSTITNCWFDGEMTAKKYMGGIVAYASDATGLEISHCLNTGKITSKHVKDADGTRTYTAGIVGDANTTITMTDCLSAGDPIKVEDGMTYYASIAGRVKTDSTISNVYAVKSVSEQACWEDAANNKCKIFDDLTGKSGYMAADLDYDNFWTAKANTTPELTSFLKDNNILDERAWYDDAVADAGNAPGTEQNPYVISEDYELYSFARLANSSDDGLAGQYFELGKDIKINDGTPEGDSDTTDDDWENVAPTYKWTPIGTSANPFKGKFNVTGDIHEIKGLYANGSADATRPTWHVGLFGYTDGAEIKNVKVMDSYFQAAYYAGAIVGLSANSTVDTAYTNARIKATSGNSAGVVGTINGGTINNCWFNGKVTANHQFVGGIVGVGQGGANISNCLTTGTIINTWAGDGKTNRAYTGGVLGGTTAKVNITNCLSAAKEITVSMTNCVGSVIGGVNSSSYTPTVDNTYAIDGICDNAFGIGGAGKLSEQPRVFADLNGANGYMLSLDFDTYWVAKDDTAPQLKSFMDNTGEFDARAWYDDAVADAQGNAAGTEKNPYIIKEEYELYSLARIVNSGEYDFADQFIILGDNLEINAGTPLGEDGEEDPEDDAAPDDWSRVAPAYDWTPIGTSAKPFKGNFNVTGDIHEIKGLYANGSAETDAKKLNWYVGLFGCVESAEIKNIKVLDSYFQGVFYVGGIAGASTNSIIDTVYTNAIVNATSGNSAGVVGQLNGGKVNEAWFDGKVTTTHQYTGGIAGVTQGGAEISNCLATGTIVSTMTTSTSKNAYAGGIFGGATGKTTVSDCLSALKSFSTAGKNAEGSVAGGIGVASASATVTNTYAVEGIHNNTHGSGNGTINASITEEADFKGANGYLKTYLTFDRAEEDIPTENHVSGPWFARINDVPGLTAFEKEGERLDLVNQNMYRADKRWYDNPVVDENGVTTYTIDTAEELVGFMKLVNAKTSFSGKKVYLGADITLNKGKASDWYAGNGKEKLYNLIPIGNGKDSSGAYIEFSGTFDGKGHSITGVYSEHKASNIGFFGRIANGSTVRDFKLINSFFTSNKNQAAAVCGGNAGGTLDTIYSDAYVVLTGTAQHVGGIVSAVNEGAVIRNCWFAGTAQGNSTYAGGITSFIGAVGVTIESCLNTGSITGSSQVGGIVGRTGASTTIKDCLNVGTIKATTSSTAKTRYGAIIGWPASGVATLENVYALGESTVICPTKDNAGNAPGTFAGTYAGVADLTGVNGYKNTLLAFDRPETTDQIEGYWVATESTPVLGSFLDMWDKKQVDITGLFNSDTTWANYPEEKEVDGEVKTTYTIDRPEELIGLASLVNASTPKDFKGDIIYLANDLVFNTLAEGETAADWETKAPAYKWTPIGNTSKMFAGKFDGQGHTISGIYSHFNADAIALFGSTADGSSISDVRITDSYFQGNNGVGSITGWYGGGTFENIYSDAVIYTKTEHGGGILGLAGQSTGNTKLSNCWFNGTIKGSGRYFGGIVGSILQPNVTIENCLYTGTISSGYTKGANKYTGGIVGYVNKSAIIGSCLSATDEKITVASGAKRTGAVIGHLNVQSTVTNVYATEAVYGTVLIGEGVANASSAPSLKTVKELQDGYATLLNNNWTLDTDISEVPILRVFAQ